MADSIRVVIVDDQPLVRSGIARILRPRAGFEIVAECESGDEALRVVPEVQPDVVLMDLRMRGLGGAETTERLTGLADPVPVLVLTTYDDDSSLASALNAGAQGFILKDASGEELMLAVRAVASGAAWIDPAVASRLVAAYRRLPTYDRADVVDKLTEREIDVLRLIGAGATNAEIAETLIVSVGTVKSHIGHIFTKLDLRDRAAAVICAYRNGLAGPEALGGVRPQ